MFWLHNWWESGKGLLLPNTLLWIPRESGSELCGMVWWWRDCNGCGMWCCCGWWRATIGIAATGTMAADDVDVAIAEVNLIAVPLTELHAALTPKHPHAAIPHPPSHALPTHAAALRPAAAHAQPSRLSPTLISYTTIPLQPHRPVLPIHRTITPITPLSVESSTNGRLHHASTRNLPKSWMDYHAAQFDTPNKRWKVASRIKTCVIT